MRLIHLFEQFRAWPPEKEPILVHIRETDRIHISDELVTSIKDQLNQHTGYKPLGFWYSFGKEWMHFLQDWDESRIALGKHVSENRHVYKLSLNMSKICVLRSKKHVDEFTRKHGVASGYINWEKVAMHHSGVEVPNYHALDMGHWHTKDNKYLWLSTWDVPSGCVWHKSAITNLKKLEPRMPY